MSIFLFDSWTLTILLGGLAVATVLIVLAGVRITSLADRLADRTGLGEAIIGGVVLGAATSLSGAVVSVTAALDGRASLAFSNGVGGIAAQTAFLALADILHRRANLEHAGAELANVFQGAILMLLLAIPLVAFAGPEMYVLGAYPASVILIVIYVSGVFATHSVRSEPMWRPVKTRKTEQDEPDEPEQEGSNNVLLIAGFIGLMAILALSGWFVSRIAAELTDRYDLSASVVGALLTAVITSLPELVTTMAAVRRGALQLAIGGIIGGNTFDTLFLTLSDISYQNGSIYHAIASEDLFWLAVALVMTALLVIGLIFRQKDGPAGIGFESIALLVVYAGAIAVQTLI